MAVGLAMITGQGHSTINDNAGTVNGHFLQDASKETPGAFRGGALYGGVIYKGMAYFMGNSTEIRLHAVQNWIHNANNFVLQTLGTYTPYYFQDTGVASKIWSYFGSYNSNNLIY